MSAFFALLFLGSAAIGRPLIYELAKAGMARGNQQAELERFVSLRNDTYFRASMLIITLVWGFGLLGDFAVSVALIFRLSVKEYLIVSPIIGYATMGSLALWTFWYARIRRREGDARRAAAKLKAQQD